MEVLCGNYLEDAPRRRRFPWFRLIAGLLVLAGVAAATPAVVSYYWNGRHSEYLSTEEAYDLVLDHRAPDAMRTSALAELFLRSNKMIDYLLQAQDIPPLSAPAKVYLQRLRTKLAQ